MIRASFLYVGRSGGRFDFGYYLKQHVPFSEHLLSASGLVRLEVDRGVSGEEAGSTPRYVCAAHLYFESAEAFYEAMALHGDELGNDVPNYTDLEIDTQVSEIIR